MRVNIQNAFIYLSTLRNAQSFDHSECSNKLNTFVSLKRSLMRANIQNAFIYLTTLRNAQSFDHSECSNE